MNNHHTRDALIGAVLIVAALTLYFVLIPGYVAENQIGAMSPRFFPRFGAVLIGIGGLVLVILSLGNLKRAVGQAVADGEQATQPADSGLAGLAKPGLITAALAGFVVLFQMLGYMYAAPLLIAVLMVLFGAKNPLQIVLVSIATTGVLYVVFSYGLNLTLV
ncbi:tripartite tricarboxylate transporter TctB family protein [Aliiroseovarius subalbicans]|uniref:tripartite tricarboxylate transporter TctB family protein n=1 Tax=Aliiroseovarius subalbicans TaxID=2925840 RepID=UPI001F58E821|nr:tripartite tricarboxylate transporter TctB family protein [Aliiroseovarius subalbicans]MCI2399070.1 tripartite tricarboxylate transporter TctB family protein [Aliiroseovarius subalbicans]